MTKILSWAFQVSRFFGGVQGVVPGFDCKDSRQFATTRLESGRERHSG